MTSRQPGGEASPSSRPEIRVGIISPPDRDALAVDIMIDDEQFAEIFHRDGCMVVEVYGRRDGAPWVLNADELLAAVTGAVEALSDPTAI